MEFIVTSRGEIEAGIVVRSAYIVISIADVGDTPAKLVRGAGFRAAIFLHFDDTEPATSFGRQPMRDTHARQIWGFVQEHLNEVGTIVCHCVAGMSRSPAIAAALAEALGEDSTHFFDEYQPNEHVLNTMRRNTR